MKKTKIEPDKWRHFFAGIFMGVVLQMAAFFMFPTLFMAVIFTFLAVFVISYGFELFSDQPIPVDLEFLTELFQLDRLMDDVVASINATEMALHKFRDIAVIAGMVIQTFPGKQRNNKSLQASSSIIFKVLEEFEPSHLLVRQAYNEVFNQQLQEVRLVDAFKRIASNKIVLKFTDRYTPLSFPIKVDSLRQSLSSEDLTTRINRMIERNLKKRKK